MPIESDIWTVGAVFAVTETGRLTTMWRAFFAMFLMTSVIVLLLSILVSSLVTWDNIWMRVGLKVLCLPIIMSLSYECIKYAGRHDNLLTRILSAPGLWTQRLTTKEPDDSMIEVAIASMKRVIPDDPNEALY